MSWASPAWAQICVQVDTAKDGLSEGEQRSAGIALADTFAEEGEEVVDPPCGDIYTVYHLKLGKSVTVIVVGSKGRRRLQVGSLEEIPSAYSQIVRSLVAGTELSVADTKTRDNVTGRQSDPNRVRADSMVYVAIGPQLIAGGRDTFLIDPSFGLGYRYELDQFGLDITVRGGGSSKEPRGHDFADSPDPNGGDPYNEDAERSDNLTDAVTLNLRGLYFTDPRENSTLYYGAGMGLGTIAFIRHDNEWSGSGLVGSSVVGYEFMRSSTIRLFLEASALLPLYQTRDEFGNSRWVPVMSVVVGGAWWTNRDGGCF